MDSRIAKWISRARGLYARGNWQAAEALCRHILAVKPHHPTALLYGGLCAARGTEVVNFRLSTAYNVAFDAMALHYGTKGASRSFFAFCAMSYVVTVSVSSSGAFIGMPDANPG